MFENDEVIEIVAWKVAVRQLAIRRELQDGQNTPGGGSESGGGGGGGAQAQPPQQTPQQTPSTGGAAPVSSSSRRVKSWFAITVVEEVSGAEKTVPDLTLVCEVPDLGKVSAGTSKDSPVIRFDDLNPGGSGAVLATSHDDIVWEVTADIE